MPDGKKPTGEEKSEGGNKDQIRRGLSLSAVGIEMALGLCIGYFGGRWLDGEFGTAPYLEYLGLAGGVGAGFKGIWRLVKQVRRDMQG